MANIKAASINEKSTYKELTIGGSIFEGGTTAGMNTGDWRTNIPVFVADKCKHCMLCVPVCPDSSIPVKDGKREDFNFFHCKGCGVCFRVCSFGAITFGKEEK